MKRNKTHFCFTTDGENPSLRIPFELIGEEKPEMQESITTITPTSPLKNILRGEASRCCEESWAHTSSKGKHFHPLHLIFLLRLIFSHSLCLCQQSSWMKDVKNMSTIFFSLLKYFSILKTVFQESDNIFQVERCIRHAELWLHCLCHSNVFPLMAKHLSLHPTGLGQSFIRLVVKLTKIWKWNDASVWALCLFSPALSCHRGQPSQCLWTLVSLPMLESRDQSEMWPIESIKIEIRDALCPHVKTLTWGWFY